MPQIHRVLQPLWEHLCLHPSRFPVVFPGLSPSASSSGMRFSLLERALVCLAGKWACGPWGSRGGRSVPTVLLGIKRFTGDIIVDHIILHHRELKTLTFGGTKPPNRDSSQHPKIKSGWKNPSQASAVFVLFLPGFLTHLGNCFSSSRSGHRCGGLHQPPHCSPPLAACREGGQGAPQSATHPLRLGANPLGLGQPKSLIPPITVVPITGVHKHRIKLVFVCVCPSCMSASSGIWGGPRF